MSKNWLKTIDHVSTILLFLALIGQAFILYKNISPSLTEIQNVKAMKIENNNMHVSFSLGVENKSLIPFSIISSNLTLYDENKQLGYILLQDNVIIKANTESMLKFQMVIPLDKIKNIDKDNNRQLYVQIHGSIDLKAFGFIKKTKINKDFKLILDEPLDEYAYRIFQNTISTNDLILDIHSIPKTVTVPLTINNNSGVDIEINNLTAKLAINKIQCAEYIINHTVLLRNEETNTQQKLFFSLSDIEEQKFSNPLNIESKNTYSVKIKADVMFFNKIYPFIIDFDLIK
ncbi:MAG TPA: hypothetical protein PL063_04555 [Candidatus Cloacimonadota bacterium]|jgi:LEA14-like dessication related protein|nr:hypothetical protein [Candidatus Cloacimonadales bacterium]HPY96460.1 hypothetical protein [Candidatus Cloacimonadota bacterium]HQB40253.1 hypothetical protein [Candidatus Cloacimonadota bacterium]